MCPRCPCSKLGRWCQLAFWLGFAPGLVGLGFSWKKKSTYLDSRPSPSSPSSCRFSLLLALFIIVSHPTSSVGSTTAVIPLASWSARWCHWALLGWLIIVVRIRVRYGSVVLGSSFALGFAMPALCCHHCCSLRQRLGYGLSSSQGGIVVTDL